MFDTGQTPTQAAVGASHDEGDARLGPMHLLQALIDNTADFIWAVEPGEFRVLIANEGLRGYLRQQRGLDIRPGMLPAEVVGPTEGLKWIAFYERAVADGAFAIEYPTVASARVLDLRLNRIDRDGAPLAISVFGRDVTEMRRATEALRQAQKLESIGRLAGGVAHDFNNWLTVIGCNLDLALRDVPAGDAARPLLLQADSAVRSAAGLTRQLLAFSRHQALEHGVVDLASVVAGVERMLRRLIGEDIRLVVRPGAGPARVMGDRGQLEQVLVTLALNARDAMPHGGVLTIELLRGSPEPPPGSAAPGGPAQVELRVTDTGTGMPPDVLERIFEPFFTTKGQGQGTGLGLATAYGIVEQHGGVIDARSEPGRGFVFRVVLPSTEAVEVPADPVVRARRPANAETVVLIEDEARVRSVVALGLRNEGYRVVEFSNGAEALEFLEHSNERVDLLLSDVVMAGMNGRAVAERARELQPALAVVLMSGYTDDAMLRHGVRHQEMKLLQKPFTPGALCDAVRDALDRAAAP